MKEKKKNYTLMRLQVCLILHIIQQELTVEKKINKNKNKNNNENFNKKLPFVKASITPVFSKYPLNSSFSRGYEQKQNKTNKSSKITPKKSLICKLHFNKQNQIQSTHNLLNDLTLN
jgi:hypothetical protein